MSGAPPSLRRLRDIIDGRLCHRCGACAGVCPHGVIRPDDDAWPSWSEGDNGCTDCGLCVRVCPGREFRFADHYPSFWGREAAGVGSHGIVLKAFLGYTTNPDLRARSTSGGMATQIPAYLLRAGAIRGAIAVRSRADCPWKPEAFVARTAEALRQGRYSKYPACSVNHLLRGLRPEAGPLLMTGLPCHLHGLRNLAALKPSLDAAVGLTVGLFCHSCLEHDAVRDILDIQRVDERDLARFVYRRGKLPGYVRAQMRDGWWVGVPYPRAPLESYHPNATECLTFLFKFYSPLRCRMCIDAMAEFADISLGDPWIAGWRGQASKLRQGYNLIFARTPRGLRVLEDMQASGAAVLEPFPLDKVETAMRPMVPRKRARAFYTIERRRRRGQPVPEYGIRPDPAEWRRWWVPVHVATYAAAERPAWRRRWMRMLLSRPGRLIVGAAFFRRHVVQALIERMARRFAATADADAAPPR